MFKCILFLMFNQIFIANSSKNLTQLAAEHFARILRDAKCEKPMPRVVLMKDLFPSHNKRYIPSGTLLHFCGSQSGCCPHETQKCVVKSVKQILLYFRVLELTPNGSKKSVEAIHFTNHTLCECKFINSNQSEEVTEDLFETYSTPIHTPELASTEKINLKDEIQYNFVSSANCSQNFIINLFSTTYLILFILKILHQYYR